MIEKNSPDDYIEIILALKKLGVTIEEIREFIKETKEKK